MANLGSVFDVDHVAAPDEVTALGREPQFCSKVDVGKICKDNTALVLEFIAKALSDPRWTNNGWNDSALK